MLSYAIAAELVPSTLIGTSAALVNAIQFIRQLSRRLVKKRKNPLCSFALGGLL
jgi:hypothetical protein